MPVDKYRSSLCSKSTIVGASTDECDKIWYCGEQSKRQYTVVFIVQKTVVVGPLAAPPSAAGLKLKTKCFMKSPRVRFDPEKLKDPNIAGVQG